MPITVNGPGGLSINFPDGTDPDTINRVMREAAGGEAAPAKRAPKMPDNPLERPGAAERVLRYTPIGSWLDEAGAAGDAAIHWATGGRTGRPYQESVEARREAQAASDAESPIRNTIEGGIGAIATAPLTPALRLLQGNALIPQMANAAATGAGYGAAYGAGEGEGDDRAWNAMKGAGVGAAFGAVVPAIARGASHAFNAMANWARPLPQGIDQYGRGAVSRVARAAVDDDIANSYPRQAQELGPEGMLADMGVNLRGQASAVATQPGPGQRIVTEALENRNAGARGRIEQDLDATLGPARNRVQLEENVVGQSRQQAGPHYEQFYQTPVPQTPAIEALMPRLEASGVMARAQRLAQIEGYRPGQQITGREWDYMKRAADDLARSADPGTNEQRLFQALARDIRGAVDNALSPANPAASPWAIAREISGDGMQFREGLEEGAAAFTRGTHPDQMAADLANMPYVQRQGFNEGARGHIRDVMGNAATAQGENGATAARRALGSEYARDKIAMVASQPAGPTTQTPVRTTVQGQQAADRLTRRLDAETTFANTRQQTYQGSQTAARGAAQKEFPSGAPNAVIGEVGKKGPIGLLTEGVARVANMVFGGALNERNVRIAEDAARMLVSQGADRDAVVRGLIQYAQGQQMTHASAQALERVVQAVLFGGRQSAISATTE